MPITLHRLDRNNVLHYTFHGAISLDDIDALQETENPIFSTFDDNTCVHVIADFSTLETITADLLPRLSQLRLLRDPRICRTVIAGANPYVRAMALSLGAFAQPDRRFTFSPSVEAALALFA